jgi:hypothetical protein
VIGSVFVIGIGNDRIGWERRVESMTAPWPDKETLAMWRAWETNIRSGIVPPVARSALLCRDPAFARWFEARERARLPQPRGRSS